MNKLSYKTINNKEKKKFKATKKPTQEDFEKRVVKIFLKNKRQGVNEKNIIKLQQSSDVDIVVNVSPKIKTQIRHLDDELTGKLWSGNIFFGSRGFQEVSKIIKKAIRNKDKKYPSWQTQDIILLLDGLELWSLLEMSKNFQTVEGADTYRLLDEIKKEKIKNFKAIYIVCKNFNLQIK